MKVCLGLSSESDENIAKSWEYCIHTAALNKFNTKKFIEHPEVKKFQNESDCQIYTGES